MNEKLPPVRRAGRLVLWAKVVFAITEMGGTMILPGSHFRRISCYDVTRHHNFVGQKPLVCPAGSIYVLHSQIWHCAQPNHTDRTRYRQCGIRRRGGTPAPRAAVASAFPGSPGAADKRG